MFASAACPSSDNIMKIYTFLTGLLKFQAPAICKFLTNLTSQGAKICKELINRKYRTLLLTNIFFLKPEIFHISDMVCVVNCDSLQKKTNVEFYIARQRLVDESSCNFETESY